MSYPDCFYCGTTLQKTKGKTARSNGHTFDHVIPRCAGGTELVHSCYKCNQEKGRLTLQEYRLLVMYRRGLIRKDTIENGFLFWGEKDHTKGSR